MNTRLLLLSLTCGAGLAVDARAQLFGPETSRNILLGGIAGAIIGNNSHHRAAEGALIGATAGYLWSAATVPQDRRGQASYSRRDYPSRQVVVATDQCEPAREVVVVREQSCPPPLRVVYVRRHRSHHERVVYVRPHARERVYVYDSPRDRCGN